MTKATAHLRWDIFCQVIDNFGDIGVCWRLAADLGSRGHRVRLWVDDASALAWMAPQGAPGVQVLPWPTQAPADGPGDVVVEAFGCEIAPQFIAAIAHHTNATGPKPLWINLEYLSAEACVERCHRLPSPLMSGPGAGLTRWFYYPGFTERTGGLLREPDLQSRAHQRTVARLGESGSGVKICQPGQRAHLAGFGRKGVDRHCRAVAVEHAHHRHAMGHAAGYQRVLRRQIGAHALLGKKWAMTEGFLHVNHNKT